MKLELQDTKPHKSILSDERIEKELTRLFDTLENGIYDDQANAISPVMRARILSVKIGACYDAEVQSQPRNRGKPRGTLNRVNLPYFHSQALAVSRWDKNEIKYEIPNL